jgi:hypothetical protein
MASIGAVVIATLREAGNALYQYQLVDSTGSSTHSVAIGQV